MATARKAAAKSPATKSPAAKKVAGAARAPRAAGAQASADIKPIKSAFTKTSLAAHVAEQSGVEPRTVKAVLAALESTMLGAMHKKGAGEFTLPGLVKFTAQTVPAKKRRFAKDPFTGEDRWFEAKPASVRVKARALKKLKDAAA